jgi:hypothetical protein
MLTVHAECGEPTQIAERLSILRELFADLIRNGRSVFIDHRL